MASAVDIRAVRRAMRRLLLEAALPAGWRRWYQFGGFLFVVFVLVQIWTPLIHYDWASSAVAASLPIAAAAATAAAAAAEYDLRQHPEQHWRMLMPGCCGDFQGFLASTADALRARPFGRPCLDEALEKLAPHLAADTLWLEFGVWMGQSLNQMGKRSAQLNRSKKVFGFDSFKGLPEVWRNSSGILGEAWSKRWTARGAFDLGGYPPEFFVDTKSVEFVVGWFNESLPQFLSTQAGLVSFIHVDSDLYSSAISVLSLLTTRIQPGAVLVFDELINYPGFREGEMRALYDWLESPGFRESGLTGVQVVGYRGPNVLVDDAHLAASIRAQRGEGRKYPQDALFRVW